MTVKKEVKILKNKKLLFVHDMMLCQESQTESIEKQSELIKELSNLDRSYINIQNPTLLLLLTERKCDF